MSVPEGFKLVPIEPTREMYLAACRAFCQWQAQCNSDIGQKLPYSEPDFTHNHVYAAMLAAALAPAVVQAEVSEWQPIATAPKGEYILIFTAEGIVEAIWSHGSWEQMPCYATYDGCGGVALSCQPTHWMPLPPAPKETA